jgi:hypothetical protein
MIIIIYYCDYYLINITNTQTKHLKFHCIFPNYHFIINLIETPQSITINEKRVRTHIKSLIAEGTFQM